MAVDRRNRGEGGFNLAANKVRRPGASCGLERNTESQFPAGGLMPLNERPRERVARPFGFRGQGKSTCIPVGGCPTLLSDVRILKTARCPL
jgi:hypothetical protein